MKFNKYILVFFLLFPVALFGQKVFTVQYESQTEVKIFVAKYESQCDLKVFYVQYESQAKEDGLWFPVQYESQAEVKIFFVEYESQADIKIYYVDYLSQAGWKNKEKQQMLKYTTKTHGKRQNIQTQNGIK